ncbi:hypothetical protein T265_07746 [Opisthorchis viverrini]|uniref:Uncharacterized protein n=1 Tax=Opisthorchis viverrini TaxID=6198 RepID=A0A074ZMV9_OPIVI|nr:hypothetical protein T265_07746 [Opisthorchis viverrini]KER24650.1 hypothetical protein T265_07746 [Opisthorchis viverrini]
MSAGANIATSLESGKPRIKTTFDSLLPRTHSECDDEIALSPEKQTTLIEDPGGRMKFLAKRTLSISLTNYVAPGNERGWSCIGG